MRFVKNKKGMTLMEIMATLIITTIVIGTLSIMLVPAFRSYNKGSITSIMEKVAGKIFDNIRLNLIDTDMVAFSSTSFTAETTDANVSGTYSTSFLESNNLAEQLKNNFQDSGGGGQYYLIKDDNKKIVEYETATGITSTTFPNYELYTLKNGKYERATKFYGGTTYYATKKTEIRGASHENVGLLTILRIDNNGNTYADYPIRQSEYQGCIISDIKFYGIRRTLYDYNMEQNVNVYCNVGVKLTLSDGNGREIVRTQEFDCANMVYFRSNAQTLKKVSVGTNSSYQLQTITGTYNSDLEQYLTTDYDLLCYKPKYGASR